MHSKKSVLYFEQKTVDSKQVMQIKTKAWDYTPCKNNHEKRLDQIGQAFCVFWVFLHLHCRLGMVY